MPGTDALGEPPKPANSSEPRSIAAFAMYCLLLVAYALMAANRFLLPTVAPNLRQEFGFSLAATGLLTTIFTAGLGLGGLPTGYLLSHYSRKAVLMAGIAVFSSSVALTTVAPGFWTLLLCLALMGIGMAMKATVMFALAASYFHANRAAAIGSVNFCYGLGAIAGPIVAGRLLPEHGHWHRPMIVFGIAGFVILAMIGLFVRGWFSETRHASASQAVQGGASSLNNRNTVILTVISLIYGLVLYGFLGMYPTFLREVLRYPPATAGLIYSFFGLGALASIAGGWLGDRFSPKLVLTGAFLSAAVLGCLFVRGSAAVTHQATFSLAYGVIGSAVLYVNLAAYHVKAVQSSLASRGSGMFVTSLYTSSALAGYLMGWIANRIGWVTAFGIQISLLCVLAALLCWALKPERMSH